MLVSGRIFPIEHGDFPVSHVTFRGVGGISVFGVVSRVVLPSHPNVVIHDGHVVTWKSPQGVLKRNNKNGKKHNTTQYRFGSIVFLYCKSKVDSIFLTQQKSVCIYIQDYQPQNIQKKTPMILSNYSDLTRPHPKWWFSKGNPLISGEPRLVKYYSIWPE